MNTRKLKKFFRKMITEDLKVIFLFLIFTLTLYHGYVMIIGWAGAHGAGFVTPSISTYLRAGHNDTDQDLLPDFVELTERGAPVYHPVTGERLLNAVGTGTDPNDPDSDNDGFTDGAEDALGSNPNSWWDPGYVWVIQIVSISLFFISRRMDKDMLREYREFEESHSSGGVSKGKFAYGGSTVFSKRSETMNSEEKKKEIKRDARFMSLTGDYTPDHSLIVAKKKKKRVQKLTQMAFVVLIAIYFVLNKTSY